MTILAWVFLILAVLSFSWGAWSRGKMHRAKAEVYQEFADTYSGMVTSGLFRKGKEERRRESKRHYTSLALCDPLIRDGLWDALHEADEHWGRLYFDPPRGDPQ